MDLCIYHFSLKRYVKGLRERKLPFEPNAHISIIHTIHDLMLDELARDDGVKVPVADTVEVFKSVFDLLWQKPIDGLCIIPAHHLGYLFNLLSPDELKAVLDCLVEQQSFSKETVGLKNSNLLMESISLMLNPLSETLIKHGFKYECDDGYSSILCSFFVDSMVMNVEESFCDYVDTYKLYNTNVGLRLQMAMELLIIIFDISNADKKMVSLLWRSQPYPFITAKELFDLLTPYVVGGYDLLREACDKFQMKNPVYPVPEESQPRSLKHLSRVQVRECLNKNNNLSDRTIKGLGIPAMLKDYLWLDAL